MPCRVSRNRHGLRLRGLRSRRRAQSLLRGLNWSRHPLSRRRFPADAGQERRQRCEYKSPQSHANVQDQRGPLLLAAAFHRIVDEPECDWLAESLVLDFRRDVELLAVG